MAAPTILNANPPKFDAAFLDRRMREHREWQKQATAGLFTDAVLEVARALAYVRQMRTRKIARLK